MNIDDSLKCITRNMSLINNLILHVRYQLEILQPLFKLQIMCSFKKILCRVINKVGKLQWTKNGFGLGTDRKLVGYARYTMIGADDEGKVQVSKQVAMNCIAINSLCVQYI